MTAQPKDELFDVYHVLFAKNNNSVEMRLKSALFVLTMFRDMDAMDTAVRDLNDAMALLKEIRDTWEK